MPAKHYPTVYWMLTVAAFLHRLLHGPPDLDGLLRQAAPRSGRACRGKPEIMTVPLMVLAALSVLGGLLNLPSCSRLDAWLEHTMLTEWLGHTLGEVAGVELNLLVAGLSTLLALASDLLLLADLRTQAARRPVRLIRSRSRLDPSSLAWNTSGSWMKPTSS